MTTPQAPSDTLREQRRLTLVEEWRRQAINAYQSVVLDFDVDWLEGVPVAAAEELRPLLNPVQMQAKIPLAHSAFSFSLGTATMWQA